MLDGAKGGVRHGDWADKLVVNARSAGERDAAAGINPFLADATAQGLARLRKVRRDPASDISLSDVHGGTPTCSAKSAMAWQ